MKSQRYNYHSNILSRLSKEWSRSCPSSIPGLTKFLPSNSDLGLETRHSAFGLIVCAMYVHLPSRGLTTSIRLSLWSELSDPRILRNARRQAAIWRTPLAILSEWTMEQVMKLPSSYFYVRNCLSRSIHNAHGVGCLYKTLVLKREELPATILLVFPAYLKVCRHLQTIYWLEPAGSHGVWCIDDYQLLPFLFGSAQLIGT